MKKIVQNFFRTIILLTSISFLFCISIASAEEASVYIDSNTSDINASVFDSGQNNYSVGTFGEVTHSFSQKYCDASSILIEGAEGVSIDPDLNLLSNAQFTVEYWLNPQLSGYDVSRYSDLENHIEMFPYNLYDFDASGDEWYHVAIVKDNTDIRYYLDGELKDTNVNDIEYWNTSTNSITFGEVDVSVSDTFQFYVNGYIEKLQIFSTSALYSANFTPMQCGDYGVLPVVSTPSEDANVYIDSNTSDLNASIVDSSENNYSIGIFGDITHAVSQKYCDASSVLIEDGEVLTIEPTVNLLGDGQFTIEYWLNPKDGLRYDASLYLLESLGDASSSIEYFPYNTYDLDLSGNRWYHVAIVKDGDSVRYYLDGSLKSVVENDAEYWNLATNNISFGAVDASVSDKFQIYVNGYIEKIRIYSGVELYDGDFSVMQCSDYESFPEASPVIHGSSDVDLAIQINDGIISVDIVDENGDSVEVPGVGMSPIAYSFNEQETTGILGVETEKIRLSNPTSVSTWSVSIAATDGEAAMWTDGENSMDYNNPNAGRLTIDPSTASIMEANGAPSQGVSLGSLATFEAGETGSITLYSADATAGSFAQYDLTGVGISQVIPGQQVPSAYTLSLTLTAL